MKNKTEITDELVAKYLSGEANPEEAEALMDWLEIPENRQYFEELQTTWNTTFPGKEPRNVDAEKAWAKVAALSGSVWSPSPKPETGFFQRYSMAWKIAATLLIFITAGLIFLWKPRQTEAPTEITFSTDNNFQSIGFPDSSQAVLNRNTKLTYTNEFGRRSREVFLLEGEAFFKIEPRVEKPFIIHTAIADVKVVGTEFNVVLHANELEVSVKQGKVLLYTKTDSILLEAGNSGTIPSGSAAITVSDSADVNEWGYATRRFVFKDTPLNKVFRSLEKAFPCSIKVTNTNITNCKITATFGDVSVEEMLNLIAETLNLRIEDNDEVFIVDGEGCP